MKAVIYCRVSPRPDGADNTADSLETQLSRLRAYCTAMDWLIVGELQDIDASGADDEAERPGLAQALNLACRARASLCVYSLSRLSRETADALRFQKRLQKARAALVSINERVDTSTPEGEFFFTILAGLAKYERRLTAKRVSDGMRRRQASGQRMSASRGRPFGGAEASCLPYGWEADPVNPAIMRRCVAELAAIERARVLRAEGLKLRQIARRLAEEGFPARGAGWHHQVVARMLRKVKT